MSKYIPAGLHKNVTQTQEKDRNLRHVGKVNQMNEMADKWKPSTVTKKEPDPGSISSIKKRHMSTREQARMVKTLMIQRRLQKLEGEQ